MLPISISFHFLLIVFLVLLGIVLMLIGVVLFYGIYTYRRKDLVERWSELIDSELSYMIVHAEDLDLERKSFRQFSSQSLFRNLLAEKLVSAESKFRGVADGVLKKVFRTYDLERESFRKIRQKRPHLIAGGIQELTAMHITKAVPEITKFIDHPSSQVYQEAQYSVVKFQGFEGLVFLSSATSILSEWQQLRLLKSVTSVPEGSQDLIHQWLESSNYSVVIFTLRLIRKFQLLTSYSQVLQLMDHPDLKVRMQTVQTLQSLENHLTLSQLQVEYFKQPLEVQIEILKAVKRMGDLRAMDFYLQVLSFEGAFVVRIHAAEGLFHLGLKRELHELAAAQDDSSDLVRIIKHALQEKV